MRAALVVFAALATCATAAEHSDFLYADLAQLVATVLVVREGGVAAALGAVPLVHDTALAYVTGLSLLTDHGELDKGEWPGLTPHQQAVVAAAASLPSAFKNATVTALHNASALLEDGGDPLVGQAARLDDALHDKLGDAPGKLGAAVDAPDKLGAAVNATLGRDDDDLVLDAINKALAKYNVVVTHNAVTPPSKFEPAAQALGRQLAGMSIEAFGVDFRPCLIAVNNAGVTVGVTGLQIAPRIIDIEDEGAQGLVQGLNIQPAMLQIQPVGLEVQPQGIQVAPYLAAVAPLGANFQPSGSTIVPNKLAVAPTHTSIAPTHKVDAPVDIAWAPVDIDLTPKDDEGDDDGDDESNAPTIQGAGPDGAGSAVRRRRRARRLLMADRRARPAITISSDPLELGLPHDYRNWGAVLAQIVLHSEPTLAAAQDALARLALDVHASLARVADGEPLLPRWHLHAPMFTAKRDKQGKGPAQVPTQAAGVEGAAAVFNYSPCVLQEQFRGVQAFATGLEFSPAVLSIFNTLLDAEGQIASLSPSLIYFSATGFQANPQAINVQPGLLMINPIGLNIQPQGVNVQPTLANIAPIGYTNQPAGHLVAPAHKVIAPTHISYSPQKITNAPVKIDLGAPPPESEPGGDAPAPGPMPSGRHRKPKKASSGAPSPG